MLDLPPPRHISTLPILLKNCENGLPQKFDEVNVRAQDLAPLVPACRFGPIGACTPYLIRDRDRIFGAIVTRRLRTMGIRDKPIAPASPWQNGFAERLIGSIRRECVDHIIVLGGAHLRRIRDPTLVITTRSEPIGR